MPVVPGVSPSVLKFTSYAFWKRKTFIDSQPLKYLWEFITRLRNLILQEQFRLKNSEIAQSTLQLQNQGINKNVKSLILDFELFKWDQHSQVVWIAELLQALNAAQVAM